MLFDRRFPPTALVCLASSILGAGPVGAQAPAAATLDVQMMQEAQAMSDAGKYGEAAAKFDELVKKFPQVPSVPEANFYGGRNHYLAGEYDDALADFKRVLDAKNLAPEFAPLVELSLSMTPQVLAAKASKLPPEDPKRKGIQEDAVKGFDVYLAKYPNSEEAESATYYKALTLFQLTRYDESIAALRGNLTKFAQSPTVQDSQYLLALTLAAVGSNAKQKPGAPDPAADAQFDESEKLFRDIIAKRQNVALMNDSQFQIGELLLARAGFMDNPDDKQKRQETFDKSLEAFRAVASKDAIIAAQKARIAQFADLRTKALAARDIPNRQKFQRLVDKETERLAQVEQGPDQTLTAKLRSGVIYFSEARWDETRVFYTQMDSLGVIDDPNEKKQADYFVTMTYAAQNIVDKAVEKYDAFENTYKADPLGENLPLAMGAMFLSEKHKDANKAIAYFSKGIELYPKGKLLGAMVLARAGAQIELGQFDPAIAALKDTLAKNPPKELAVDAEFYLGTIFSKTGKLPEAVKQFKDVRDKFPGTPQAEQAHFQVGQILSETDPKGAIPELQAFFTKYPKSPYTPPALFALGKAQAGTNQSAEALVTFKKVATDFPKSDPAPYSYFERAKILLTEQKFDECLTVMKEFIKNYPDSPALFQAYDFIAQIQTTTTKSGTDAIKSYEEFVTKRPKDPSTTEALLKIATLWKTYADSQGPYLAIEEAKRVEWRKGVEKSAEAAEKLLTEFPESQQVAKALNTIMDVQRLQQAVKLKTEADIEKYFKDLAEKFSGKPGTRAKVLFTLAALTYDKDKAKAVEEMSAAYKPDLKFAPEDLDLYGQALIENKKIDEAIKVYEKLDNDYKITGEAKTAPREAQEARAIVLAGLGKAYQSKGDAASKEKGGKMFSELEQNFPWSPKMLEVNYGIAVASHEKHDDEDAIKRIREVIKAQKASAELRAKSMLLLGDIDKDNGRIPSAIDNYIKISVFYTGVPKIAAEGLWRGAQLLEDQSTGKYPMPTPTPKPVATPKPAGAPKATPKK
ncbi:MAG: tetratricopeptide repeat protein [Chthoniobacter sp.]|uniref:tetratricopeptide repeat protein n=1 Tax=Chthoniobacter sp. TaxID=2510640 RepID=UPI0032AD9E41